ncbi:rhodanese-like domain-containing protein [Natronorubrum texcoconense]|uniref:Rhodanese-related sulfurtransferase n=1 Tax=Natronorubrum texcoconense TaxID=1095776 RepID=A0A1G9GBZ4_9EURY|nr:rhodanese-like domain-containing protein [Natronorubrum texcoconense]SDK98264.1 Rhodanese-related sulfurtransferase [Natronorubrum texcoconense]
MNRRQFFTAGAVVTAATVAGCLGGDDETDDTDNGLDDADQGDGYGPEPDDELDERSIDTDDYETMPYEGIEVPLAPLEDVYYWYARQEARIVDTRDVGSFEDARIVGAALSPAPDGGDDDPVAGWAEDDRIVTYCVCPHAMAVQRAAGLIDDGYENVYALDDGFQEWIEAGYPLEGNDVDDAASASLPAYHVEGRSDPAYAGEYVSVRTVDDDKQEMSLVDADGSYELTLHFTGLSDDSLLEVEAPDYTRELTLAELTSDVVTA